MASRRSRFSRISISSISRKSAKPRGDSFGGNLEDFGLAEHKNNEYNIVFEGYLHKKGQVNKAWKKRWCIIYEDGKIAYFKEEGDDEPAGYVDLLHMTSMVVYLSPEAKHNQRRASVLSEKRQKSIPLTVKYQSKKGDDHTFGFEIITPKRVWEFRANDMNDQRQWIDSIRDYGFGRPVHQGSMKKADKRLMQWKGRYFVLYDNNEIRYFEKPNLLNPKNKILLNFCTKIELVNNQYQGHPYCIEIVTSKPDRIWVLEAENASKRNKWVKAIRHVMEQNVTKFEPEHDGYLSQYMPESNRFIDNYFVIYRTQQGNPRLYCFKHQIGFKQIERAKIYGRKQLNNLIKNKTEESLNMDLRRLVSVEVYSKYKFENANPERKENPSSKVIALNINNEYHYFCLRTESSKALDQWVCAFQQVSIGGYKPWYSHLNFYDYADQNQGTPSNSESKERLEMMFQLKSEKYDDWMIGEAIKRYEDSPATISDGHYNYEEIKNIINHIAANVYVTNTDTDDKTDAMITTNSSGSPVSTPSGYSTKSQQSKPSTIGGLSISTTDIEQKSSDSENDDDDEMNDTLFDENYETWTVTDVVNWFQCIDDGWLLKHYGFQRFNEEIRPNIVKNQMDGKALKNCNVMNLIMLGFKEDDIQKKILDHVDQLGYGISNVASSNF